MMTTIRNSTLSPPAYMWAVVLIGAVTAGVGMVGCTSSDAEGGFGNTAPGTGQGGNGTSSDSGGGSVGGTTASSGGSGAATGSTSMTGGNGGVGGQAGGGPPLNGLVAYYPLDGDAQDASGNGYHGVVNNMSCAEPAVVGQGCYTGINGGNAQVNPYPLSPSEPAGFSGAIWAKLDGLDGERLLWDLGYESFAAKYFGIGEGVHCIMRSGEDIFYNQNEQGMPPDNFVPTPGAWHHIACVFDRQQGDMRLYIDGALLESYGVPFVAFPSESNDGMGIGCRGSGYCAVPYTEIHNAVTIDELRLYNRPLSAAEVKALM